jgi:hypothetical protein
MVCSRLLYYIPVCVFDVIETGDVQKIVVKTATDDDVK